ncbi:MAG: RibD family protein [Rhodoblastus sp.]
MARAMTPVDRSTPAAEALARISGWDKARPFVVAQLGQSLDGRIATASGESFYINGAEGLDHLHRLRAAVDAVVVGAGTISADNPQLTVRRVGGRSPARVVVDPRGRLGATGKWLADDGAAKIVVSAAARSPLPGVETVVLPSREGRIAPADIVAALAERGFRRILVEGGAATISSFVDADAIDRLHIIFGCAIIGSGRPGLELAPIERLAEARRPATEVYRLGRCDFLFDCALRDEAGR